MFDCGFTKENNWFRYRAAAIIVEDGCVLFAGNEHEDYYSIGGGVHMGETAEDAVKREVYKEMHWIPIEELDKHKAFPSFLKDYLSREHSGIEHIITDERK